MIYFDSFERDETDIADIPQSPFRPTTMYGDKMDPVCIEYKTSVSQKIFQDAKLL